MSRLLLCIRNRRYTYLASYLCLHHDGNSPSHARVSHALPRLPRTIPKRVGPSISTDTATIPDPPSCKCIDPFCRLPVLTHCPFTRLKNFGRRNTALDLSKSQKNAGTPVLSHPINNPRTKNQAWLLEHLESLPSVQATPAPLAPGPCEFPEADQQALRGGVVEECNKFRFANTVTQSALDCYDEMKLDLED